MKKKFLTYDDCTRMIEAKLPSLNSYFREAEVTTKVFPIPRGGVPVAMMLIPLYNDCTANSNRMVLTSNVEEADVIVDDIRDSGATISHYLSMSKKKPLVFTLITANQKEWVVFPWETNEMNGPEENIRRVMEYIGEDVKREGLLETPERVIRSYDKLFGGYKMKPEDVMKTFTEGACSQMVLLKDIEVYSTCEHHMLPFFGKCHIAYIPKGKVIGVSKLARLMEIYSRRMQIQERIGQQIADAIEKFLQPAGVAVMLECQHFCMTSRGVEKQNSKMVTSELRGEFLSDAIVRAEFYNMVKN